MALKKRAQYGVVLNRIVEIGQVTRGMDHSPLRSRRPGGYVICSSRALCHIVFPRDDEHRSRRRSFSSTATAARFT